MLQNQILNLDERHNFQTKTLFKTKPSEDYSLNNNLTVRFQNILDGIRPIQLQKLLEDFHGDWIRARQCHGALDLHFVFSSTLRLV